MADGRPKTPVFFQLRCFGFYDYLYVILQIIKNNIAEARGYYFGIDMDTWRKENV